MNIKNTLLLSAILAGAYSISVQADPTDLGPNFHYPKSISEGGTLPDAGAVTEPGDPVPAPYEVRPQAGLQSSPNGPITMPISQLPIRQAETPNLVAPYWCRGNPQIPVITCDKMEQNDKIMKDATEKGAIESRTATDRAFAVQREYEERDANIRKELSKEAEERNTVGRKGMKDWKEKQISAEEAQRKYSKEMLAKLVDPNDGPLVADKRAYENKEAYDNAKDKSLEDLAHGWWGDKQWLTECTARSPAMQMGMIMSKGVIEYYNNCNLFSNQLRILEELILDTNRQVLEYIPPSDSPAFNAISLMKHDQAARANEISAARTSEIREKVRAGLDPGPDPKPSEFCINNPNAPACP